MRISDWSSDVCSSDLPYTRQLRLAEVGRDVNRVERDHRHQWLAGIHECADAHRLLTDHAVDGRRDLGIGELQLRSGLRRLRLGKCSLGLFKIGFQDVRLLSRRLQARAVLVADRSEEHTSELQSLMRISYAVFCLQKKKKYNNT